MMNLLISENDEIIVKFAVAETVGGRLVADTTKKDLLETFGIEIVPESCEEHSAVFRKPSFGDTINMSGSLSTDTVRIEFNPLAIRFARIKTLLKSWTLVSGGEPIPCTPEMIIKLDPVVVNIIGLQLDAAIGASGF